MAADAYGRRVLSGQQGSVALTPLDALWLRRRLITAPPVSPRDRSAWPAPLGQRVQPLMRRMNAALSRAPFAICVLGPCPGPVVGLSHKRRDVGGRWGMRRGQLLPALGKWVGVAPVWWFRPWRPELFLAGCEFLVTNPGTYGVEQTDQRKSESFSG